LTTFFAADRQISVCAAAGPRERSGENWRKTLDIPVGRAGMTVLVSPTLAAFPVPEANQQPIG
jgi:hypothetical protein